MSSTAGKLAPYVAAIRKRMRDGWLAPRVQQWLAEEHGLEVDVRSVRKAGRGETYEGHPAPPAPSARPEAWASGEASPHAKLTADEVRGIYAARPDDWVVGADNRTAGPDGLVTSLGQTELAEEAGVSRAIIRRIWNEQIWTSVTLEADWDAEAVEVALCAFVRRTGNWPTPARLRTDPELPDPPTVRRLTGLDPSDYRRYLLRRPDVRRAVQRPDRDG